MAVKRQGSKDAFLDRQLEVRITQDNGGVLGFQPQNTTKSMGLGVLFFQKISDLACADEGKNIDPAGTHKGRGDRSSFSVDHVDDSSGKAVMERLQKGTVK